MNSSVFRILLPTSVVGALVLTSCGASMTIANGAGGGNGGGSASNGGGSAGSGGAPLLASAYRGDVGIATDPDVIWAEQFDEGSVSALSARYTQAISAAQLQLVNDGAVGAVDRNSLRVTAVSGVTGGGLYRYFPGGHEEVWLRYYIRYHNHSYHHTTVNMGGINPAVVPWVMQGPSGLCCTAPDGDKAFSVSAEVFRQTGGTFPFDFYNYWFEMKAWGDIVTPPVGATERDPITNQLKVPAAGNGMLAGSEPRVNPDRWYCIEIHLKLNTPTQRDGLLGLWIDGQRVQEFGPGFPQGSYVGTQFSPSPSGSPFPGLRWRSDGALKLNYLWITHYATGLTGTQTSVVEYDQLVLAKRRVGPIQP